MVLPQQARQQPASVCSQIRPRYWRGTDLKNTTAGLLGATLPCFASQLRLKSWRRISGFNTTTLEEFKTTNFRAEVGRATQLTQLHLQYSTLTWHTTCPILWELWLIDPVKTAPREASRLHIIKKRHFCDRL